MDSSESSEISESNDLFPSNDPDFKFIGRDWLFSKLSKHLNNVQISDKNVILLLGKKASGKTCLLRQLVQTDEFKNQTLAYYEEDEYSDDCSFVLELVKQLKKKIPYLKVPTYFQLEKDKQNYSTKCIDDSSNESLFKDQEDDKFFKQKKTKTDIFWNYVLFPLIEHGLNRWDNERYIIFIDSIDLKNEILDLIVKYFELIPKFLIFILTATPKRRSDL